MQLISNKSDIITINLNEIILVRNKLSHEKSKRGEIMNTFRNKQFKNELDPKYLFYDCLHSCELISSSEKTFEKYKDSYDWKFFSDDLDSNKK